MRSRTWHGLLALVILASLVAQFVLLLTGPGVDPVPGEPAPSLLTRFIRLFSYFTIQSNLILLIGAVAIARRPQRDGPVWRVLRLDGLLGILVTGIVFATVLTGTVHPRPGLDWAANAGFHYVAPWWALAGWLVFGPRPRIDRRTLTWAVLWPALWIAYTLAHGAVTGWYPYPFTDVGELGYPVAVRNMLFVVVLAVLIGTVMWVLDRRLPCLGSRRPDRNDPEADADADAGPDVGLDLGSAAGEVSGRTRPGSRRSAR